MSGKARLPGGEPRRASQRKSHRAVQAPARIEPNWRPGDQIRWKGRSGVFRRDLGDDEHAEVTIVERVYRVRTRELE